METNQIINNDSSIRSWKEIEEEIDYNVARYNTLLYFDYTQENNEKERRKYFMASYLLTGDELDKLDEVIKSKKYEVKFESSNILNLHYKDDDEKEIILLIHYCNAEEVNELSSLVNNNNNFQIFTTTECESFGSFIFGNLSDEEIKLYKNEINTKKQQLMTNEE